MVMSVAMRDKVKDTQHRPARCDKAFCATFARLAGVKPPAARRASNCNVSAALLGDSPTGRTVIVEQGMSSGGPAGAVEIHRPPRQRETRKADPRGRRREHRRHSAVAACRALQPRGRYRRATRSRRHESAEGTDRRDAGEDPGSEETLMASMNHNIHADKGRT